MPNLRQSIRPLLCIIGDRPRPWVDWLPWAEYYYNTSFHSALRTTPFQVVYGRAPPSLLQYQPGSANTDTVDKMLTAREEFLEEVHVQLLQAQDYSRRYYDAHYHQLEFSTGDWVWLHMLNRPTQSLSPGSDGKLAPKYAGPFQITKHIGSVAYRLSLPDSASVPTSYSAAQQWLSSMPTGQSVGLQHASRLMAR